MNTCDADRVEQIRQAVLEQAHCELPVETIGHALRRWSQPYVDMYCLFAPYLLSSIIFVSAAEWFFKRRKRKHEGGKPRIGPERAPDGNRRKRRHAARLHD